MNSKISIVFFCLLLAGRVFSAFAEAPDPAIVDSAWGKVSGGLHVSFGSIDVRYSESSVPDVKLSFSWKGAGCRGERVSAQAVLWADEAIERIECEFTPFTSAKAKLPSNIAQVRFVRYVLTDEFGNACRWHDPAVYPPSPAADMLDTLKHFDLNAKTACPVWLSFNIPADAKPGVYTGKLKIVAKNRKPQQLDISLEVLPQTLPRPKDWAFHLDLWQHPSAVARVHNVKPWSEEHWALLEAPMAMLAAAGQKVITANINKDPWNHQCYDAYEDMIVWTKEKDGTWQYDYTVFDRWVNLMMRLGIRKEINCYSMIPWNNELHYRDAAKGTVVDVQAIPGTDSFAEMWSPFLKDFSRHLKEKGWLEITNIAIDERAPKEMQAMLEFLTKTTPEIGVALADNHKSYQLFPDLKDVCISFGAVFDGKDLALRKEKGLVSTMYVCCAHEFPNVFTFSNPAEGAYIGWYTAAAGLDGFLRWAYNSWTENPETDSRFRTWPAGDTYIIYPGGRSSIRFERLREGIQDFEKIRILREQLQQSSASNAREKLAKLNKAVAQFNRLDAPEIPCGELVNQAKNILNELSIK
ncbi:MAG: DUF4091 domain-containing protein [Dysgonamonadaceae bacterium]|jgi:hypothetical protein|nr:DUF4091 domain-containing protein [Dysgonamonadaceae bacterium]